MSLAMAGTRGISVNPRERSIMSQFDTLLQGMQDLHHRDLSKVGRMLLVPAWQSCIMVNSRLYTLSNGLMGTVVNVMNDYALGRPNAT
jgi:hypothetical protein